MFLVVPITQQQSTHPVIPFYLSPLTISINNVNYLLMHETKYVPEGVVELFVLNFGFSWLDKSMAFTGRSLRTLGRG